MECMKKPKILIASDLFLVSFSSMGAPVHVLCLLCLSLLQGAQSATFTVTNRCGYTVWPGILSNAGVSQPSTTGFVLYPGQSRAVSVAAAWSGRMWGRTLCEEDSSGRFTCATGDCGSGAVECSGRGADPPATLAEFTLAGGGGGGGDDFYDVSLVDGYNLPILVAPQSPAANGSRCQVTGCVADLNKSCPAELRVVKASGGGAIACNSACEAFGAAQYCCSGAYGTPSTCAPTSYSLLFKNACPRAYSYAYDDATSTFTCAAAGGGYDVVFCPGTSSLKSGGNPEAKGLPPTYSTMAFSGNGHSSTTRISLFVLLMIISSATWTQCW
ncbi:hypothetical protein GUJ93_ZPchr0006g43356 [Zizania palustris]|uniref:Thaumatin-like protein n=1 Tax=Zizania palustris TaxID=103762 RepID=A0A8J5SH29_ZIZPA|nr:hypothetical protein GUJ93_ZPchr0006g43356 [Zizania palustris]